MQTDRRVELAIGIDVFAVVLFVAVGRRTHDEGSAFAGVMNMSTWRWPLPLSPVSSGLHWSWRRMVETLIFGGASGCQCASVITNMMR